MRRVFRYPSSLVLGMAVVSGVALFLRVFRLEIECASRDECFSWRIVQYPVIEQIERTAADVHPPLYYLLLSAWSRGSGLSMPALRGLSVLLSLAAIPVAYLAVAESLAWRSVDGRPRSRRLFAALGASLVAVHTTQVEAGRIARMYSLGVFLTALSAWLMLRALRAETRILWWWCGYGTATAAVWYTHYFGFFTTVAQLVFVAGLIAFQTFVQCTQIARQHALGAAVAVGIAMALYAPWVPAQLAQIQQVQGGYWIAEPEWADVRDGFFAWSTGLKLPALTEFIGWSVIAGVVTLAALWRSFSIGLFWLVQAAAAWVGSLTISWWGHTPIFQERYLVFSHVGWVALASIGLAGMNSLPLRVVFGWLIASTCVLGAWEKLASMPDKSPAIAEAMQFVQRNFRPGDTVTANWVGEVNRLRYYSWAAGGAHMPVRCRRLKGSERGHTVHVASLEEKDFLGADSANRETGRWWSVAPHGGFVPSSDVTAVMQQKFRGPGDYAEWTVTLYESGGSEELQNAGGE